MKRSFLTACVGAAIACVFIQPAFAISLSLGLKAEARATAGLDAETRALIERMPKEIKEQTLDLLQKALPMLDVSVEAYLKQVDKIISGQLVHASCTIQGTLQGSIGVFKSALPFQSTPAPVTKISEEWSALKTQFKASTQPATYISSYADFLANTVVTACQVEGSEEAVRSIETYQADARARWQAWRRVGGDCKAADECAAMAHEAVSRFVFEADPRDRQTARADERLTNYVKPKAGGWFTAFRQEPFEDAILYSYRIQDSVSAARSGREWAAIDKLEDLDAGYLRVEKDLQAAWAKLRISEHGVTHRSLRSGNAEAKSVSGRSGDELNAMISEIDAAIAISGTVSGPAEELKRKCRVLAAKAEQLNNLADAELRKPETLLLLPTKVFRWP